MYARFSQRLPGCSAQWDTRCPSTHKLALICCCRAAAADPSFTRALVCRYTFEQLQPMRVVVFDVDTSAKRPEDLNLAQQDYIGGVPG